MLKKVLVLVLLFVSALSVTSAQSSEKVVEEIKKMDRQWQVESYSSRDLKDYDRVVAEDFLITGSNGKILTKAEKKANVKADYTEFAPGDIFKIDEASHKVRILDDDVAISTGVIIEKYVYSGNKIDSRVHFTCTYLKRKGAWQVVAAHYTRIKQQ
jgi:hypothetical protein